MTYTSTTATMALEQSFGQSFDRDRENGSGLFAQKLLEQLAASHCPLLVVGEAGTGKRGLVNQIHQASARSQYPLRIIFSPAATIAELEEGYQAPGTLYLESVSELNREGQNFLLDKAQLGHNLQHYSDGEVRIVCGSLQPLGEAVRAGKVREEFYYAVAGVTLQTVPLRHRRAELVSLAEHYLESAATEMNKKKPVLNAEFHRFLMHYSWPGNLPELQSAMKACVLIGDQEIALSALQAAVGKVRSGAGAGVALKEVAKTASMKAERELISEALHTTGGNRKQAARDLKISYKALLYKLKRIGLEHNSA